MRRVYLVTYDIADPKRLRLVAKILKGFGQRLQLSVFQCDLTPMDRVTLEAKLHETINTRDDQVLFFDLGATDSKPIKGVAWLGRPTEFYERKAVIV